MSSLVDVSCRISQMVGKGGGGGGGGGQVKHFFYCKVTISSLVMGL